MADRRALIDGDEVAFKAYAVATSSIDWGDGDDSEPYTDEAAAIRSAFEMVRSWSSDVDAKKTVICLSCRDRNLFRKKLLPTYKQTRTEKHEVFWKVIEALSDEYRVVEYPMLEADDVMGVMTGDTRYDNVIVSSDKDMKTVPGKLFVPNGRKKRIIKPAEANHFWMLQTLMGDTTDGYKGCPKVGEVKATEALKGRTSVDDMWNVVCVQFRLKKLDESDALLQARMARILRPGEYDPETGVVKLWKPKGYEEFKTDGT